MTAAADEGVPLAGKYLRENDKKAGGLKNSTQFMWFGDGNTVWHKETPNSEITWALMNKMDASGDGFWPFPRFIFQSLSFFTQILSVSALCFLVLFSNDLQPVGR